MDKSFVKSKIIPYHIQNLLLTVIGFFIVDYFFETDSLINLIAFLILNLILIFGNPSQFLVNFEIDDEKIIFVFINSYFAEKKLVIPIKKLQCYEIESSGYFSENSEIIFHEAFSFEKFIIFDRNLIFRLEKFCKSNAIKLKTGFLQ
jgi:hypothetical protein